MCFNKKKNYDVNYKRFIFYTDVIMSINKLYVRWEP